MMEKTKGSLDVIWFVFRMKKIHAWFWTEEMVLVEKERLKNEEKIGLC